MKPSALVSAALLSFCSSTLAVASPVYTYVGAWEVDSGPWWGNTDDLGNFATPIYSGVEAAAAIFGGAASDYVTSTVGPDEADIDFQAWYDGFGMEPAMFSDTLHADPAGSGLYAVPQFFPEFAPTWSAWVYDHAVTKINYAFRVSDSVDVPEPGALSLIALGLLGLGLARREGRRQ